MLTLALSRKRVVAVTLAAVLPGQPAGWLDRDPRVGARCPGHLHGRLVHHVGGRAGHAPGFGGYYGVCGTSAASPMFSGVVAIADQYAGRDLGQINGALYGLASSSAGSSTLFDVTDGNNVQAGTGIAGYSAGAGWDAVTGLGTPNGANFVPALVAAANS